MAEHLPEHVASTGADGAPATHAEPTAFGFDASGWVALAMVAVLAICLWKRVPAIIGGALDKQIATIREQLAEAAQLRGEAEALKAEYEGRAAAAEAEAATMIERARHEADAIVEQAKIDTEALINRRTSMAEDKIAAAERNALDQIRTRAATAAASAASALIAQDLDAVADKAMIDRTIEGLAAH